MKRRNDKVVFGSEVSFDVTGLKPIMGAVKNALGREIEGAEFEVLYGEINDNYRKASRNLYRHLLSPERCFSCILQVGESLGCPPVQFKLIVSENKDFKPLRAGVDWKARRYVAKVQLLEVRTVYDFRVDGVLLDLDSTAMSDVLEALREIAQKRVDLTDECFNEYVTRKLCKSYSEKNVMGNCRLPMLLDTGLTYREGSIEGEDGVLQSGVPIWMRIEHEHDNEVPTSLSRVCRIRIVLDPEGPFEYVLDPRECVSPLHRDVARASIEEALPRLRELAETEDWGVDSLGYYLKSVYHRLIDDEKVDKSGRWPSFCRVGGVVVFCTGLFTRRGGHFIYAKLSGKKDGRFQKLEWLSHVTSPDGHVTLDAELGGLDETGKKVNHGLPYPPNWIREPERLLFDYHYGSRESGDIDFNFPHIYQNLKSRGENPSAFIARYPQRTPSFDNEIRKRFGMTRKRLQGNFKIAIPTFYRGEIQLLVPLYLEEDPEKVSVALVVTLNRDPKRKCHYYCPTCLSLDMARRDARVITRVSDTWLEDQSLVRSYGG